MILDIATIAKNLNELIMGRADKGIKTFADLKGKKVAFREKQLLNSVLVVSLN